MIPLFIIRCLEGGPLPIYGDGMNVRDWLFVEDHCRGIEAVLERGREGETYNIGGRCELPNLTVIDTIVKCRRPGVLPGTSPWVSASRRVRRRAAPAAWNSRPM